MVVLELLDEDLVSSEHGDDLLDVVEAFEVVEVLVLELAQEGLDVVDPVLSFTVGVLLPVVSSTTGVVLSLEDVVSEAGIIESEAGVEESSEVGVTTFPLSPTVGTSDPELSVGITTFPSGTPSTQPRKLVPSTCIARRWKT